MSVVHDERSAQSTEPSVRYRTLLRRLVVRCPVTERAADTGFDLSALPNISARRQVLVDCLECGQDHEWQVEDAFVD